jgi:hypothetical protein
MSLSSAGPTLEPKISNSGPCRAVRRPTRISLLLLAAAVVTLSFGCERKPSEEAAPPCDLPETALATPEETARTVLGCIQADLRAVARDDKTAVEACLAKLQTVASARTIRQEFARLPQFKVLVGDELIKGIVSNWAAALAYYADGLHLKQMRRVSESDSKVVLVVPASGPDDKTLIQITCVHEDDGLWRVARIEFVPAIPASQPTSQPTTQP